MDVIKPYRLGALAYILNDEGSPLLVQHNAYGTNQWSVPGGGREEGEDAIQNAIREVSEEVSISPAHLQLVGQSSVPMIYDFPPDADTRSIGLAGKYQGQHKDQVVFRYIGPVIRQFSLDRHELRDAQWCPLANLKQFLLFPDQYQKTLQVLAEFDIKL